MKTTTRPLDVKVRRMLAGANFGHLATLREDGSPHVTAVWVDVRDDVILVNTARGRVKERNVRRNPVVGLSIADNDNPYATASITGRVRAVVEEGADEHIDAMAKKYLGKERYPFRAPGEQRVILEIEPERVSVSG